MSGKTSVNLDLAGAWLAARHVRDGEVVFVGIGAPCLAAMLARRLHAPGMTMIFESGVIGADPASPPLSTGSPSVARNAAMVGEMLDAFATLQQGRIDLGLLSAAQVDRFGNLNSTVLGCYASPSLRLPGSGGAHDISVLANRTVIIMPHEPKRFVPQVDFVTSPGISADGRRGGPSAIVTPLAEFSFAAGELTLTGLLAGWEAEQALAGFSWKVPIAKRIDILPAPSAGAASAFASFVQSTRAAA
jgi:glutaconate CoA-transferase, subunit B